MASNGTCTRLGLAAVALVAIACDDGGGLHSGVAGNKALKDLSNKEIQKICDAANDFIDAALPPSLIAKALCAQQALMTGEVATCRIAMQACVDDLSDGGTLEGVGGVGLGSLTQQLGDLQCFSPTELDSCKASVSELEGCLQNTFAAQSRLLHAASCELLAGTQRVPIIDTDESPLCAALEKKCPGLTDFSRRPDIPGNPGNPGTNPPPGSGSSDCADLDLQFDGTDCASSGCSGTVRCTCSGVTSSYGTCNSARGCLSSLDCDVACGFAGSVYACVQQNTCESDSDCGDSYCVMTSSASTGSCSRGRPGDACVDGGDCSSGECMSDPRLGSLRCKGDEASGSSCSSDFECASGICARQPSTGSQVCSDGDVGDPCSESTDCQSGACVYTGSAYMCSDRAIGSPCSSDSDCESTHCASTGSGSICVSGSPGDPCDSSSDCSSGRCTTSPSSGERTCAYQAGQTCPLGVADCNGECRVMQASCSGSGCSASCGGVSCGEVTLATWSPTDKSTSITLANGDLTASATSSQIAARATIGQSSGRWYWEITAGSVNSSYAAAGVLSMSASLDYGLGNAIAPGAGYNANGSLAASSGGNKMACSFSSGDVIGVALDLSSRLIYFSVNGVWQAGGDPGAGSGGLSLGSISEMTYPAISLGYGDQVTANFGQSAFAHAPPTGYQAVAQ